MGNTEPGTIWCDQRCILAWQRVVIGRFVLSVTGRVKFNPSDVKSSIVGGYPGVGVLHLDFQFVNMVSF